MRNKNAEHYFLSGGGEMGVLIRAKDWGKTSLGSPQQWPQSLLTTLSIIFNSKFPMFLFWGPELICFYNDAYRPSLGNDGKHPDALGKPGKKVWPEIWHIIQPLIDQVMAGGEATWSEDQLIPIYRNGKMEDVYWTFSYSPVTGETGSPAGVFVTCVETTEKINTHKKLEARKGQLKFTIEAAELATFDVNVATNKCLCNHRFKEWFGFNTEDEIDVDEALTRIAESDRQKVIAAMQAAMQPGSGGNYKIEHRVINPLDNNERIILAKGKVLFDQNNIPVRFSGTGQDITEQVMARKEAEEKNLFNQVILESNPDCVKVINTEGRLQYMNHNGTCLMEIDDFESVKNKPWVELWGKENSRLVENAINDAMQGKTANFQALCPTAKGTPKWFDVTVSPIVSPGSNKINSLISVSRDVTEQVNARKIIKDSQEQLQNIFSQAPAAIAVLEGAAHTFVLANSRYQKMTNRSEEQMLGKTQKEVFPELEGTGIFEIFDNVFNTGQNFSMAEYPLMVDINNDGIMQQQYFNFTAEPIKTEGKVASVMVMVFNITEQVIARKKIEESEQRFQAAIEAVEGILWTNNGKGEMEGEQRGWAALTGQTYVEYQGYGWANAVHPDDAQPTVDAWNDAVKERKIFIFEHRIKTKDGQWRDFSIRAIPLLNIDGSLRQWVGVHTDITERKQQQQILAENEQRLRLATQTSGVGIWEWNVITNKIWWDAQMFRIYGVTPTADGFVEYSTWSNAVAPEDLAVQEKILQDTVKNIGTSNRSFKLYRANDGMLRFIDAIETVRVNAVGQAEWVVGTNLDVTEQKKLTAKLNTTVDNLRLYEKVVVNTNDAVLITEAEPFDLPGPKILYVNDAFCKMSGYTKEEVIGKSPRILQGPKTDRKQLDKIRAALSKWESVKVELINYTKDGREFYVEFEIVPLANEEGWFTHWVSVQRDVTERKMAELQIQESEERFRNLAEALPQMVWVMNDVGEMEYGSKNWKEYSGIEDVAEAWNYMMHPDDSERLTVYWRQVFAAKKGFQQEMRLKNKEGIYRWFYSVGEPVLDADEKVIKWVGSLTDIHEQKTFAEQLEIKVEERTAELAKLNQTLIDKNEALLISENFNRSLTEYSPNVIYIYDVKKNKNVYLNQTGLKIIGNELKDIIEINDIQNMIVHEDDLPKVKEVMEKVKKARPGEIFEHEYRVKNTEGQWVPFLARDTVYNLNENNEVSQILGIGIDITELKKGTV
jgi:PAS domain S-box-containing protein